MLSVISNFRVFAHDLTNRKNNIYVSLNNYMFHSHRTANSATFTNIPKIRFFHEVHRSCDDQRFLMTYTFDIPSTLRYPYRPRAGVGIASPGII